MTTYQFPAGGEVVHEGSFWLMAPDAASKHDFFWIGEVKEITKEGARVKWWVPTGSDPKESIDDLINTWRGESDDGKKGHTRTSELDLRAWDGSGGWQCQLVMSKNHGAKSKKKATRVKVSGRGKEQHQKIKGWVKRWQKEVKKGAVP
jgi:hypothetical protein